MAEDCVSVKYIRMLTEAKNSVEDYHSEDGEEDRIDGISGYTLMFVVNMLLWYHTKYKRKKYFPLNQNICFTGSRKTCLHTIYGTAKTAALSTWQERCFYSQHNAQTK